MKKIKTQNPNRVDANEKVVDFESTGNRFITGGNLDTLKLLQSPYLNKVKMIYIDPPYNAGTEKELPWIS
jgi:adenine specific DNA methylase Mod